MNNCFLFLKQGKLILESQLKMLFFPVLQMLLAIKTVKTLLKRNSVLKSLYIPVVAVSQLLHLLKIISSLKGHRWPKHSRPLSK